MAPLRKGKFFVIKMFVDETMKVESEWYLALEQISWNKVEYIWDLKPKMHFGFISGSLHVLLFRKKERLDNVHYGLITVGDYQFINAVINGAPAHNPEDIRKDENKVQG